MDTTVVMGLLIVGAACGFPLGQWWAEMARGKFEAQRAWENRSHYRRRNR
jgi:hypothetical protein